jgi:4-hydroxy-3-polyprenylbenzoate decarboxylase
MLKNKIDYQFLPGDSMAYRDLRGFLDKLEALGELHRVQVEVDPELEIAEITDRVSKSSSGNKALLFESVKGSAFSVVTNMFGSYRRICIALEIGELDELNRRMEGLFRETRAASPEASIAALPALPEFRGFAPEHVTAGACQEVVESVPDLARYPFLKNWSGDGQPEHDGRFITLPLVITGDPDSGEPNCGMYRVEAFGAASAGIHWRMESGGAGHHRKYLERGERMPVAVAIGGDPAVIYVASAPLPENIDEMQLAGFLRSEPVRLVKCLTCELMVPAEAELVLEGYLEPGEEGRGGAFGNHTGFYAAPHDVPVMHITCITRRRDMIYPATVVGRPPMEDCYMAKASERLLLSMIRLEMAEIIDINLPLEGIFHGCAIVALEKRRPGHPREVMESLWAKGWFADARFLVIVDADIDVHDLSLIAWKVLNLADWRQDLVISATVRETVPLGRLALDATRKVTGAGDRREIARGRDISRLVENRWREYGLGRSLDDSE